MNKIPLTPGDTIRIGNAIYMNVELPQECELCVGCDLTEEGSCECRLPKKYNCFPGIMKKIEENGVEIEQEL